VEFVDVKTSLRSAFAITKEGDLYSWGNNKACGLGHKESGSFIHSPKLVAQIDSKLKV